MGAECFKCGTDLVYDSIMLAECPVCAKDDRIAALEAENERLRCCGNCKSHNAEEYQRCTHGDQPDFGYGEHYVSSYDACDMKPSRWDARG